MSAAERFGDAVRPVCDRFWLFTIAAIALSIVGVVVGAVIWRGMPSGAGELLSGAVTGLLMLAQKVIEAQGTRRMMDQLQASTPAPDPVGKTVVEGAPA